MGTMPSIRERAHRDDVARDFHQGEEQAPAGKPRAPNLGASAAGLEQLQLRENGQMVMTDERSKREAAAEGLAEGDGPLPHLDAIQRSFGPGHDLSAVRAHVGGAAARASSSMGAARFASGNRVAFSSQPDLALAAHEAAHVVQQRGGVQLKGGVGQAGDAYERNADAVAERVVAGQSAADLLPGGGAGASSSADAGVQLYTEVQMNGAIWRVSESGDSALKQDGKLQTLYATQELIDQANAVLAGAGQNGSFITLTVSKDAPKKPKNKELRPVVPVMKPKGSDPKNKLLKEANKKGGEDSEGVKGGPMALWADCGRSSRTIMGTDGAGKAPHAEFTTGDQGWKTRDGYRPSNYSDAIYKKAMTEFLKDSKHADHCKKDVHYTGTPAAWAPIIPTTADQARTQYWELGEAGRKVFDQYSSINTAANPEIGGAYTMNTEYRMPGSDVVREEDGSPRMRWNFHWGGVVMKDGPNNITLENYAVMFEETGDEAVDAANREKAYDWTNREWKYQMYGTVKEGQTFHEQHLETGTHGTRASTFAAKVDD